MITYRTLLSVGEGSCMRALVEFQLIEFQAVHLCNVVHAAICQGGGKAVCHFPLGTTQWWSLSRLAGHGSPGVSVTPQPTNPVLFKPLHIIYLSDFLHEDNPQTTLNN